jgi:polyhydroxybutyrate depolymerase
VRRALAVALVIVASACREKKPPPQVHAHDGESTVLPRIVRPPPDRDATRSSVRSLVVSGRTRRYVLVEPARLVEARSYPLVLVFHGDGGDAQGFHEAWPFEHATGADAFLAYPEGIGRTWDLETTRDNPDEQFVVALVDALASTAPIDRARVFAAGYSSGGFMSNVLACHRPDLLRAIASNAGGAPYNQLAKWGNGYPKCPGQKPVAMLALHGERDHGVTLDSGRFSAEYWAHVNGCNTGEMETTGYPECRVYRGCPAGKAVGFCSVPPLGHWVWSESAGASWTFFERQ